MKNSLLLVCTLMVALAVTDLRASRPRTWTMTTQADFLKGDAEGVSITSDGQLVMAPELESVYDTEQPLIHSAVADLSGNVYLGTGSNGKIFRVDSRGVGQEFADLDESGVYALAVDSMNRLYAGTTPGGRIYRLDDTGRPEEFFNPGEKFIWAMVFDGSNNLYVATGPKGILYRVTPSGQGAVLYDSSETHLVSLTADPQGRLIAGTAPSGMVIRVDSAGRPFVLFDSAMAEIRSVALDRYGTLFVSAIATQSAPPSKEDETASAPAPAPAGVRPAPTVESQVQLEGSRPGARLEIYRLDRDNLVEKLYTADASLAFDLLVRPDGAVLAGTSDKGRLISVSPGRLLRLVTQTPDEHITHLVETRGGLYLATSNLGRLYRLKSTPSAQAEYRSDVLDAEMVADWGRIRWKVDNPADPAPRLFTRSGNTEKPDSTWSDWEGPYPDAAGSPVTSTAARYLQWKVEYPPASGESALLSTRNQVDSVDVSYLQKNMAPVLSEIVVHPPGYAFLKPPDAAPRGGGVLGGPEKSHLLSLPQEVRSLDAVMVKPPPRPAFIPGARSVSWKAADPNRDDLVYSVYYRAEGARSWILLEEGRLEKYYTMDGASLSDGTYQFRVVASDRLVNPAETALDSELVSKSFVVSNTAPRVQIENPVVSGSDATIRLTATAVSSRIFQVDWAVGAGDWKIVYPEDGIADSGTETFELRVSGLASGEHRIRVRVIDTVGNIGTGSVIVRVP